MKKEDFIKMLQDKLPDGIEVCLFDHRKNMHDDSGDGSSEGVYPEFEAEVITLGGPDEEAHYKEQNGKDFVPWAAITFDNDDYED